MLTARRRFNARSLVIASAGCLAGCSIMFDASGLMGGGGSEAGVEDAARTVEDGGVSVDSVDGTVRVQDASAMTDDASAHPGDAAGSSDGGPTAFNCTTLAPAPLFCSSFSSASLTAEWTAVNAFGGGTGAVDNAFSLSPPGSFVVSIPKVPADTTSGYSLIKSLTGVTKTSFEYGFAYYNDSPNEAVYSGVAEVHLGREGRYIHLITYDGIIQLQTSTANSGFVSRGSALAGLTNRVWHQVLLKVTRGAAATASVSVDGVDLLGTVGIGSESDASNEIELMLGPYYQVSNVPATNVHYDNVFFR